MSPMLAAGPGKGGRNCHSFSGDARTLPMDLDDPTGDKGACAIYFPGLNISFDYLIVCNGWNGHQIRYYLIK
jgi:hypothetical protein